MAYLEEKKKKRGICETVYKRAGNHSNLHLKYFTVTLLSIRLAQRFKERRESNKAALKQPCLCGERIFTLTLRSPFFFFQTRRAGEERSCARLMESCCHQTATVSLSNEEGFRRTFSPLPSLCSQSRNSPLRDLREINGKGKATVARPGRPQSC